MSIAAFALRSEGQFKESVEAILGILKRLKEQPLRKAGDSTLSADMDIMNRTLQQYTDEDIICNMQENQMKISIALQKLSDVDITRNRKSNDSPNYMRGQQMKRNIILQDLYSKLAQILHYVDPSLISGAALRMVELTLSEGITPSAPLAFAYYGESLLVTDNITEGCRLGKLKMMCTFFFSK